MTWFFIWLLGAAYTAFFLGRHSTIPDEKNGDVLVIPMAVFWPLTMFAAGLMALYMWGAKR